MHIKHMLLIAIMIVMSLLTGCGPELTDSEQVAVDFSEALLEHHDTEAATKYIELNQDNTEDVTEAGIDLKKTGWDSDQVKMSTVISAGDEVVIVFHRPETNDGLMLEMEKAGETWQITEVDYDEKLNEKDIEMVANGKEIDL